MFSMLNIFCVKVFSMLNKFSCFMRILVLNVQYAEQIKQENVLRIEQFYLYLHPQIIIEQENGSTGKKTHQQDADRETGFRQKCDG